jgi:hypothetical protein
VGGRPLAGVHDLLSFALRGVEHGSDRFITVCVVARDVEELPGRTRQAVSESVDEGGVGRAILKRRDGIVVGCTGKLGAALGEAPDVLAQAFSQLLLAVAQLPLIFGVRVLALEVPDEDSAQVGLVVDLVAWQVLEPHPRRVAEVERQVLYDEEVVCHSSRVACEPVVLEPHAGVGIPILPRYVGRIPET